MKHALSFDIEDWFHIVDIPELEDISKWDIRPSIVEQYTDLILSILEEFEVKATFFVLGWVAKKYPKIAKKIVKAGHELGTHSFWHRRVYELTPEIFYDDLKLSIDVLQDQTGVKLYGFRAPSFSIIPGSEWAFDIINEVGLKYDASLFPASRGHGGFPCPIEPHTISRMDVNIPELPMSIYKYGQISIPFSGGGYLRALPYFLINHGFQSFKKKGIPVVVYLHPRDFAADQPKVSMPLDRKFKSYVGLSTTENKLRSLLKNFEFTTCEQILKDYSLISEA